MSSFVKQLIATLEEQLQQRPNDSSVKARLNQLYAERTRHDKAVIAATTVLCMQLLEQKKLGKLDKKVKVKRSNPEPLAVPPPPAGRNITCCDCAQEFFFAQKEEELFLAEGMQPRKRCAPCLKVKKDNQPQPIELCCVGCKGTFTFSVASQKNFKAQGWAAPKRCHNCRAAKKTKQVAAALLVTDLEAGAVAYDADGNVMDSAKLLATAQIEAGPLCAPSTE
jgi:hypothetical protein